MIKDVDAICENGTIHIEQRDIVINEDSSVTTGEPSYQDTGIDCRCSGSSGSIGSSGAEEPTNPVICDSECCPFGAPTKWQIDFGTITNTSFDFGCPMLSGVFILEWDAGSSTWYWENEDSTASISFYCADGYFYISTYLDALAGAAVIYRVVDSSFNCNTGGVLSKYVDTGDCAGFPATITISPAEGFVPLICTGCTPSPPSICPTVPLCMKATITSDDCPGLNGIFAYATAEEYLSPTWLVWAPAFAEGIPEGLAFGPAYTYYFEGGYCFNGTEGSICCYNGEEFVGCATITNSGFVSCEPKELWIEYTFPPECAYCPNGVIRITYTASEDC